MPSPSSLVAGRWWLAALIALLMGLAAAAPTLTDAQEAQAARIEQGLRCPVCQGESVYDSRAQISNSIREEVAAQVVQGQSDAEITAYFQRRFGDSILMQPPVRGVNLWLWGLPVAVVLIGGAWLTVFLKNRRHEPEPELNQAQLNRVDAELRARRDAADAPPSQAELSRVDAELQARRREG